jgi:exosome complex component RRP41
MPSILAATSCGLIQSTDDDGKVQPCLDLNNAEEQELSFLSLATVSGLGKGEDKVSTLVMETRVSAAGNRLEAMLATGVDGCKMVRKKMEDVVREQGRGLGDGKG